MKSKVKLAIVLQNSIPPGNIDQNLAVCLDFAHKAAVSRASIVIFPEMNITGYLSGEKIKTSADTIPECNLLNLT